MKFLHVADLHIGKVINDFSMLEDQRYILSQIADMAKAGGAQAVVIAGDVYDRAIPPAEAVTLFDGFLNELSRMGIQAVIISGNHDSPERLSFGESLLSRQGVHIAGIQKDVLTRVSFQGKKEETEFVLFPFMKPAQAGVRTSGEAVELLLKQYWEEESVPEGEILEDIDILHKEKQQMQISGKWKKNRVLVTHFFVTDAGREPELSDSETSIHVGGLDNVDVSLFQGFDYVALGHIHKPQRIGDYPVWYAGAPLQYSFGEAGMTKAALMVTLDGQGLKKVEKLPLFPMRSMRKIEGTLKELLEAAAEENPKAQKKRQDYIQAVLTDQGELIDPIGTLRSKYPNVMQIVRKEAQDFLLKEESMQGSMLVEKKDTLSMFEAFYREVRDAVLSDEGKEIMVDVIKELEG